MARVGVQFSDIEKAAFELHGNGKVPTVDGIRELLGTGSKSTIARHLRAWRAKQTETEGQLPQELAALVTGLWKKLHEGADQRIVAAESLAQQEVVSLNKKLAGLYQDQAQLKNQLHQAEEQTESIRSKKQALEETLIQHQQEQLRLQERNTGLAKQLEASKAENARLAQLTTNIQTNLEHYQDKMQKQQAELALQSDKRQNVYLTEVATLKQQLGLLENQLHPVEKAKQELLAKLSNLEDEKTKLLDKNQAAVNDLASSQQENKVLIERLNHIEARAKGAEKSSSQAQSAHQELEKEHVISQDQNQRLQTELLRLQDKLSQLRQENQFLIQEKSQLEGFIKASRSRPEPVPA